VRRVPVRVELDQNQLRTHPLRLGLSVETTIDIHNLGGQVLAATPRDKTLYQTDVYASQGKDADELIEQIIGQNGGNQTSATAAPSPSPSQRDHGSSAQ